MWERRHAARPDAPPGPRTGEAGMSLIELVVAMTVFSIFMTGIAWNLAAGLALARGNQNRSVAANLASQEMDTVRSTDFDALTDTTTKTTVGGIEYTIHRTLTWVNHSATNGPCEATNASPEVLRVDVDVDWPMRNGIAMAHSDSILTPPTGSYNPSTGHIAVRILDRAAEPAAFVPVTISGTASRSEITNDQGCAFFAFLPAGAYNVVLNATGYVDRQGSASPSQTANVSIGHVTSTQFDFDRSASVVAQFDAEGGLVASDLPISIGNTSLLPTGVRTFTGTGTTRTLTNLFPSTDGYDLWAGSCADADPEGLDALGVAYYPGAMRTNPASALPGGSVSTSISLGQVRVRFTNAAGTPLSNLSITITHAADKMCGSGETHTYASTGGDGTALLSLPFGTWTITSPGHPSVGVAPSVTISPVSGPSADPVTAVVQ
jgi:prepilin-type N-terminal cleavage/methylation domain-containing protein